MSPHPVVDKAGHVYFTGQTLSLTGLKYTVAKFPAGGNYITLITKPFILSIYKRYGDVSLNS